MESTKSIIFIASLHCSLRKNCRLNVLLLLFTMDVLLLLLLLIPFLQTSIICFWRSVLLFTNSKIKVVIIFISLSSFSYILVSFFTSGGFLISHFLECFHNPTRDLYSRAHKLHINGNNSFLSVDTILLTFVNLKCLDVII